MIVSLLMIRYDQGVFSGIIGNENFRNQFGNPDTGLEGIIVSIYNLGCFTGCIFAFFFCERTGRRLAMWIAMGFIIVSLAYNLGLSLDRKRGDQGCSRIGREGGGQRVWLSEETDV
jgi:MFS family permease